MTDAPAPMATTIVTSSSTAAIAPALAKFQGDARPAPKDAKNPYFGSNYADLASCWEAVRAPLAANGLSLLQIPETTPTGLWMETRLLHASGEFIAFRSWWPVAKAPPRREKGSDQPMPGAKWMRTAQTYGSAITYARRYTMASLLGIAAEEDDGNAASGIPSADNATARARAAWEASRQQQQGQQMVGQQQTQKEDPAELEKKEIAAKEAMDAATTEVELAALGKRFNGYPGDLRAALLVHYKARMAALRAAAQQTGGGQ